MGARSICLMYQWPQFFPLISRNMAQKCLYLWLIFRNIWLSTMTWPPRSTVVTTPPSLNYLISQSIPSEAAIYPRPLIRFPFITIKSLNLIRFITIRSLRCFSSRRQWRLLQEENDRAPQLVFTRPVIVQEQFVHAQKPKCRGIQCFMMMKQCWPFVCRPEFMHCASRP